MKNSIILLLTLAVYSFANAQGSKTPEAVTKGFNAKFPGASKPSWEIENGKYEGAFTFNGKRQEASFDKDGNWLDTESGIKISDLPKEVADAAAKQLAGYKITSAEKVEANDGKTYYDVDLAKGNETFEARFSPTGELKGKWKE
jgi:uncharacterized membrane protein YkoI